ncbi:MAG: phage GP46 family protein [Desulfocapsaceae bacterium]|nr:phage GP46 family protein [Desulfocapsaceae bacterium]
MDFSITMQDGLPQMSFDPANDLFNNVYLSVTVVKGAFFHNPGFGLRSRGRLKNTAATAALIRQDYLDALQWLIDIGRAKSVEVAVERDRLQDLSRLKLLVTVTPADGSDPVTFTIFKEVV